MIGKVLFAALKKYLITILLLGIIIVLFDKVIKLEKGLKKKTSIEAQKVAYINFNQVKMGCKIFKRVIKNLENINEKETNKCNELNKKIVIKIEKLEKNKNILNKKKMAEMQNEIDLLQNKLMQFINENNAQMIARNYKFNQEIKKIIIESIKNNENTNKYSLVFDSESSFFVHKDPMLDISNEVVEFINKNVKLFNYDASK